MDEANNDIFMNNLFHAELKLSRQKKTDSKGTTKSKPLSTMPGSNQHPKLQASSKVGTELEVRDDTSLLFEVVGFAAYFNESEIFPCHSQTSTHSISNSIL